VGFDAITIPGSNYQEAKTRLYSTEKSLRKNPEKLKTYNTAIMEYVDKGFAHELTEHELLNLNNKPKCFIPPSSCIQRH